MQDLFNIPFQSRGVNPFGQNVTKSSANWVNRNGLLESFPNTHQYKILMIGQLVARTHPTFSEEELQLIADWAMWLFINDDLFDHLPYDTLRARIERYHQILHGAYPLSSDDPFTSGLAELWKRTLPLVSKIWVERFTRHMHDHLQSSLWEAMVKLTNQAPDMMTFIQMRQVTSGIDAYIDLLEIKEGLNLPPDVHCSPPVQRLVNMVNNITSWANEILSVEKEVAEGDSLLNMVWLYHYNENISIPHAYEKVKMLCQSEINIFTEQARQLPKFGHPIDEELQNYVSLLKDIAIGTIEWHWITDRYRKHWTKEAVC